ncbi:membrane dipeptidase [Rhizobium leguminosarum]|uniref:membrane dipeptidase n=1 Tax=Rhizobium leguminosarum TaxID=384 RepID=UPI001C955D86|nr:membrane dipeptidase [Rhizobium leguminosarum]MBY5361912.1 hypothetical protein [Rhizobium leguminosarum]MBY5664942.1 hypothetical protein [Rhizobium leguminosarum]MBY5677574.1 hypothetical protein [Rhizobium leguminosarum]
MEELFEAIDWNGPLGTGASDFSILAEQITQKSFVFDALALPYSLEPVYLGRYLRAGVNAIQLSVATDETWEETLKAFENVREKIERDSNLLLCTTAQQARSCQAAGKLGVFLGTQGAGMIGGDLSRVERLSKLGLRFMGLCYTGANLFGDGCGETRDAGLTFLGRDFISEVNKQKLILDLSHSGHRTRLEAVELAIAPVCTHTNSFEVTRNDRNIKDIIVSKIAERGGCIGLTALPKAVNLNAPSIADLYSHYARFASLYGSSHIGIGLDFSEAIRLSGDMGPVSTRWRTLRPDIFGTVEDYWSTDFPRGIETIDKLSNFAAAMLQFGVSRDTISAVLGSNWVTAIDRLQGKFQN